MALYRVKDGQVLPHHGVVLEAGAVVELPAHVAGDHAVAYRLEPVAVGSVGALPGSFTHAPADAASPEESPSSASESATRGRAPRNR